MKEPATVQIAIYNQFGEQVRVIENQHSVGIQQVVWNAEGMAVGVYYCVLRTDGGMQTVKLIKM